MAVEDVACDDCGERNPAHARFCLGCGAPFRSPGDAARKLVTVLFADVVDSTALSQHLDPEPLRELMLSAFRRIEAVITSHGGTVEKFIGDAVMAVFGIPTAHEDDALRAVRAADELRVEIARLDEELVARHGRSLRLRTGVNTGEVMTGGGRQTLVTGEAVNVAARLEQLAEPGEVLLGPSTAALVARYVDLELLPPVALKGLAGQTSPARLVAVHEDAHEPEQLTAFVGRDEELEQLEAAFAAARRSGGPHVVTVLGGAGVGKSRLVAECARRWRAEAAVALGRCPPYGRGITFWPVREAIERMARGVAGQEGQDDPAAALARLLADVAERDRVVDGVLGLVGLRPDAAAVDPTWAARRLLEAISARQPLVVVLDAAQWVEPGLMDLVEHVLRWWDGGALLVVVVARPELLERRPTWATPPVAATTLHVDALDDDAAAQLVRHVLGDADPLVAADETVARVVAAAGGNPLFLEELALDARAGGDAARTQLPHGVRSLLAARIDRLGRADRLLLQRAAVVGEAFEEATLRALTPVAERPDLRTHLLTLLREGLVQTRREDVVERYAFRHALLRDVAYGSMPLRDRLDLHAKLADHLVVVADERGVELDAVVGHHLEQAASLARALGEVDRAATLATGAGSALLAAGRHAHRLGDVGGAVDLLARAAACLEDDPRLPEVLAALGSARTETGDLAGAGEVLDRAVAVAAERGDDRLRTHAELFRLWQRSAVEPVGWTAMARTVATEALEVFTAADDALGLARAWVVLAEVAWSACRFADVADALARATAHARAAGDLREEVENLAAETAAAVEGPLPVASALQLCEEVLRRHPDTPALRARVQRSIGLLQAATGDAGALATLDASIDGFRDLGQAYWMAVTRGARGRAAVLLGDPAGAEGDLRRALEELEGLGDRSQASRVAANLARVRALHGDADEALELAERSRSWADVEDLEPQVGWRVAAAYAHLAAGDATAARSIAEEARDLAADSDALLLRADVAEALARVARAQGDEVAAREAADAAAALRRSKLGAVVDLADATNLRMPDLEEMAGGG